MKIMNSEEFIGKEHAKIKKRQNYNENRKVRATLKNLEGFKWIFGDELKDAEFDLETVENAAEWIDNLEIKIDNMSTETKIKLMFDKLVIVQNQINCTSQRKKLQNETILLAFVMKDFNLLPNVAKLSVDIALGKMIFSTN
jgi:hypothetical protein